MCPCDGTPVECRIGNTTLTVYLITKTDIRSLHYNSSSQCSILSLPILLFNCKQIHLAPKRAWHTLVHLQEPRQPSARTKQLRFVETISRETLIIQLAEFGTQLQLLSLVSHQHLHT